MQNSPDCECEKTPTGWGGKRAGAGRPRKPPQPKPEPSALQPRLRPGMTFRGGFYVRGTSPSDSNARTKAKQITTTGSIGAASEAFIYVGVSHRDGLIKIGMSGQPHKRCRSIAFDLLFTVPVVVPSAKLVETLAFRELGLSAGESEYVRCSIEQAIDAVSVAWMAASKLAHIDPAMTPDQARMMRIGLAA